MKEVAQDDDFALEFSSKAVISAPLPAAFSAACDYFHFEDLARARGLAVTRHGPPQSPLTALEWHVSGPMGGAHREAVVSVDDMRAPVMLVVRTRVGKVTALSTIQFIENGRKQTLMNVRTGLKGRSIAAKLVIHSLRLSRQRVARRFEGALTRFATLVTKRARDTG